MLKISRYTDITIKDLINLTPFTINFMIDGEKHSISPSGTIAKIKEVDNSPMSDINGNNKPFIIQKSFNKDISQIDVGNIHLDESKRYLVSLEVFQYFWGGRHPESEWNHFIFLPNPDNAIRNNNGEIEAYIELLST